MPALGPRLVVAGTSSGVGKTTVATGLMAALAARGLAVASAKVGPDFIDPGYHAMATGRPPRNLDAWICGSDAISPLAARAGAGADVLVVEGVMGLFDGAADGAPSSTAEVAQLLGAPIVLVVDASAMSQSVAALVHGFHTVEPGTALAGVILNQIGSDAHEAGLRAALAPLGLPVLGALHRDDRLRWRDRHLGLVPVVEQPDVVRRSLDALAHAVAARCDLDAILQVARGAGPAEVGEAAVARRTGQARVAVVGGPAFSFQYPDNLEALVQAGAEVEVVDPLVDERLPGGCQALVAGGGFPEAFGPALAANRPLLDDVAEAVGDGLVVWAECGGLLWLARSLDGQPMAGVLDVEGHMTGRLTLGYRSGTITRDSPLGPAGTPVRGHEFHYSTTDPVGDALELRGRHGEGTTGFAAPRLLASYLHLHLGGDPAPAEAFVAAASGAAPRRR